MRIGAKLPNTGALPVDPGVAELARRIESAGFDSAWTSDHVVMVAEHSSPYPYSADGKVTWDPAMPWFDAITVLATAAAVTERIALGVAVLILPLRDPVVLAKQLASIDALSHGRLVLGVGSGWLAEEFEALDVPFATRGGRTDEWLALLRNIWTGAPEPSNGAHHSLPAGVLTYPTPAHEIPIYVGGGGNVAWRRAARAGSGWLCQQNAGELDPAALRAGVDAMNAARPQVSGAAAPGAELDIVLRIGGSAGRLDEVAPVLDELQDAGVSEIIVDIDWTDDHGAERAHDLLRGRAHV